MAEIIAKILEVTTTPLNKMRIMYMSNLNFQRFNSHFHNLLKQGLIVEVKDSNGLSAYKITERGRTLLDVLRKARELLFSEE